jgi:hypothetical protein
VNDGSTPKPLPPGLDVAVGVGLGDDVAVGVGVGVGTEIDPLALTVPTVATALIAPEKPGGMVKFRSKVPARSVRRRVLCVVPPTPKVAETDPVDLAGKSRPATVKVVPVTDRARAGAAATEASAEDFPLDAAWASDGLGLDVAEYTNIAATPRASTARTVTAAAPLVTVGRPPVGRVR